MSAWTKDSDARARLVARMGLDIYLHSRLPGSIFNNKGMDESIALARAFLDESDCMEEYAIEHFKTEESRESAPV